MPITSHFLQVADCEIALIALTMSANRFGEFEMILSLVNIGLFGALFISHASLAATYTPPADNTPGQVKLNHIIIDSASSVGATIIATDNNPIYGGQVYEMDITQLPAASGGQDATFDSTAQKLSTYSVTESATVKYDITLLLTAANIATPNIFNFTVTELTTRIYGEDSQLLTEKTFIQGPKGEIGATGATGAIDLASKYTRVLASAGEYYAHCPSGSRLVGGGAGCPTNYILSASYPSDQYSDSWFGSCRSIEDLTVNSAPFKINALCIAE